MVYNGILMETIGISEMVSIGHLLFSFFNRDVMTLYKYVVCHKTHTR